MTLLPNHTLSWLILMMSIPFIQYISHDYHMTINPSPQNRERLLHRLGELEEHYDGLQRYHSETEMELANTRANLDDRKRFCQQLQEDCEGVTDRITNWAKEQR